MRSHLLLAGLVVSRSLLSPLSAQETGGERILVSEHRFAPGSSDSLPLELERRVFYVLEVEGGAGEPVVLPVQRYQPRALVVPAGPTPSGGRRFELHTGWTGAHLARLPGIRPGAWAVLRVYRDDRETDRAARARDRDFAVGLMLGGGWHSGYRLDPTGGDPPGGGGDLEGCVLAEAGSRLSVCLGIARQRFPDSDFAITWYFLEPRFRVWNGDPIGASRTDIGVALRLAQGAETKPRNISPSQLAAGIYLVQHLAPEGRRRGWSVYLAYSHGRLGNVPETEFRDTDRFSAGLTWVP
jgi:hypothetical protein